MTESSSTQARGNWNSKIGFIMAAAGSAIGLGNIWGFPTKVASNGGAAFLIIYIFCCFLIGFPVMVAEMSMGRKTGKSPVGAFRALGRSKYFPLIGAWGVLCGFMILSFYNVVAGWTLSYVFQQIFAFFHWETAAQIFGDVTNGTKNAFFSGFFMLATILIVNGGVSGGIEKATKLMMPLLLSILVVTTGYVLTLPGAEIGLKQYLLPDFSKITPTLVFEALGQSFFSLSLGMGALITYGSYLSKNQNIPESAAWVTISDLSIAFLAGLLIIPAMYVAQLGGIKIFDESGQLLASTSLVFNVLPALFDQMNDGIGLIFGILFFALLSIAALTSTISLLEVPVSFAIDEYNLPRKRAAWIIGGSILSISLIISFNIDLIGSFATIFNDIGLPLGGLLTCLFLGYIWGVPEAIEEMKSGFPKIASSLFVKVWPIFIKYICPALIAYVFVSKVLNLIS